MPKQAVTLADVRAANGKWFSPGNKKFFHDVRYWLLRGKRTHNPWLLRSTYAWSDMLGQPKKLHYRLNEIDFTTLKIGKLIDESFDTREEALEWLKNN
jgi:hypothetical protein